MDWNPTPSTDRHVDRHAVDSVVPFHPTPARPVTEAQRAPISDLGGRFDPTLPQPLPGGRLGRITG